MLDILALAVGSSMVEGDAKTAAPAVYIQPERPAPKHAAYSLRKFKTCDYH